MTITQIIFWSFVGSIFYTYFGYPLFLYVCALFKTKQINKSYISPDVSIVVAAFNEEKYIKRRIENILQQDYPVDKMEIVIVSDGSYDSTVPIVKALQETFNNISLDVLDKKSGKAVALNLGVSRARGEIVVFADARQVFQPNTVKELVANFNDPDVGAVSGELFIKNDAGSILSESVGLYWEYEKWLRKKESQIDSVIGATGAIYAIRKELYETIPEGTILDDIFIPMKIALKGFRVVFDENAKAYDDLDVQYNKEFKRKVRTLTGNFQILSLLPELFLFTKNRVFLSYISHKVLRLIVPYFLVSIFMLNLFMLEGIYFFTLIVQVMFYLAAFVGYLSSRHHNNGRLFLMPYIFILMQHAAVLGFYNFIMKREGVWEN